MSIGERGPVETVTVTGSGAIFCSGAYGTLIAYDASGNVLGQTELSLIAEYDCNSGGTYPDNVTFGAQATLTVAAGETIARFEITAMSPLEGPVWDPINQVTVTGHFYQNYTVDVKPGCPPTDDPIVDRKDFRDLANPQYDTALAEKGERNFWVYENVNDLSLMLQPNFGTSRDECSVFNPQPRAPAISGYVALASYHTHTLPAGTKLGLLQCAGAPVGAIVGAGPSEENGDLSFVSNSGIRMFIIDPDSLYIVQPNKTFRSLPWSKANGCR